MKKIIHLSDLHIGHKDCGEKFRALIDNITFLKQPAGNYAILVTGDIVDNGMKSEQTDEAVAGLTQLVENGYRVLVVPGNHDYGTGTRGYGKSVTLFKERYFGSKRISYPKVDIIGKIAFIGLDSTADELHWHDRFLSEGEIGVAQLMRLRRILKRPEVISRKKVVYLHHHPFDFIPGMQLKDSSDLKEILENRVDMLLFGHYHVNSATAGKIYNGVWGIPRCYNAGSSTHKNGNIGFHRVIDLSNADPRMDYDGNFI